MDREEELAVIRRAYAKQVLAAVDVAGQRLEDAFAAVHREDFLGPGPWPILRWGMAYRDSPTGDPVYLYTNDLVGILPARRINNGQPSLHAHLLNQAHPGEGEHVVHIGIGTGYYTAIMAWLAGHSGRVTGIEFEPELAARARANFRSWPNVQIVEGDGARVPFGIANVIYVNAGATRPAESWLDNLADGGRLVLPLTTDRSFNDIHQTPGSAASQGAVFLIERRGSEFHARRISAVAIFPCAGARDEASEQALAKALANVRMGEVTRLYRDSRIAPEDCWLAGEGWCLAYA